MSDKAQSDSTIPDHYVSLECKCGYKLATAERALEAGRAFCLECGHDFTKEDIVE